MLFRSIFSRNPTTSTSSRNADNSGPTATGSPPPSYRSLGYTASDSSYDDGPSSASSSKSTTSWGSLESSTTVTGGSNGIRLLTLHYMEESMLTQCLDRYEEIESTARRLFSIPKSEQIFIEVMVSALKNKRMKVDPKIWAAINDGVSEAWISTQNIAKSGGAIIKVQLSDLNPPYGGYEVTVPAGARIHNLKTALLYLDPRLKSNTMLVWRNDSGVRYYSRANALGPVDYVVKGQYFFSMKDR